MKSDKYMVVLYDVNNNVAGVQSYIPKNHNGWTPGTGLGKKFFVDHTTPDGTERDTTFRPRTSWIPVLTDWTDEARRDG